MNIYGGGILLNTHNKVQYRPIKDDEIKALFEKIKLNTDFSFPDRLIQDFINDGSMKPTYIKCTNFEKHHFDEIVLHIKKRKNIKKKPPKPYSKKNKKIEKIEKNKRITKNKRIKIKS